MGNAIHKNLPTLPLAQNVDLKRFSGPWYVTGVIPTPLEKNAYNPVESYEYKDGKMLTTFIFNAGDPKGPLKTYHPVGFPSENAAVWSMMFFWPVKVEYLISYLKEDYSQTIIARTSRDYAWVMARTPSTPEADHEAHKGRLQEWGYDVTKLIRPHQDPLPRKPPVSEEK